MAWSGSGLFCATFQDILDPTQLAVDVTLTTNKIALFLAAVTPDYNAAAANAAYGAGAWASNEASGTGYTAGGIVIASPTLTFATGILTFDHADSSWAASSITARGCLEYADALAGNNAIFAVDFGADYTTSNGTFLIQWNASGIWTMDLVP